MSTNKVKMKDRRKELLVRAILDAAGCNYDSHMKAANIIRKRSVAHQALCENFDNLEIFICSGVHLVIDGKEVEDE